YPSPSIVARSPVRSHPSPIVAAVACGLAQYPGTTIGPLIRSSPTSPGAHSRAVPGSTVRASAVGLGQPTEETRRRASAAGRQVAGDDVSVSPYVLWRRHRGSHSRSCRTVLDAVGAPP